MRYDRLDEVLIGRTVLAVFRDDEKNIFRFVTDTGDVTVVAEGDCCSNSWFEHVSGLDALVGHTVVAVENVDMPEPPEADPMDPDALQAYGVKLTTEAGTTLIEYRNQSNGYYGGYLRVGTLNTEVVKPVTEDF